MHNRPGGYRESVRPMRMHGPKPRRIRGPARLGRIHAAIRRRAVDVGGSELNDGDEELLQDR